MSFLKKFLKYGYEYLIDNVISKIFLFFPVRNVIFFESVPNICDSPKAVFEELINRGYNQKYKMIWWLYDDGYTPQQNIHNVYYLDSKKHRLIRKYYEYTSKCMICCNRFLESHKKEQKSFYIIHGSPLKQVVEYYHLPDTIDYYFGASEHFRSELSKQLSAPATKEIDLGLPRNDEFGSEQVELKQLFGCEYKKIIVWYPTFRQHKAGMQTGCSHGFPLVHDTNSAEELNQYAKERETIIVIKPHFAQDLKFFKTAELSNIKFINDDFFLANNITSYKFINSCDALISDYSSIYYDYLLCDKPIALVWEDIEEYRIKPGFSVDIDFYCKGGEKIYTLSDLMRFIDRIANEEDILKKERREINALVNYSCDRKNTERVTDKIIEISNL